MEPLVIAGKAFQSRLIVGTGKYKDGKETQAAIEASGAEMVTVAVRRVNLDRSKESLLDFIDPQRYFLLPNTAGCYTADEAIRAARLGREVGLSDWHGCPHRLIAVPTGCDFPVHLLEMCSCLGPSRNGKDEHVSD